MKKQLILFSVLLVLLTFMIADITYNGNATPQNQGQSVSATEENIIIYTDGEINKKSDGIYKTETGQKYHLGDCRYLKKSKFAITLSAAKEAGLIPCKVCKPPN